MSKELLAVLQWVAVTFTGVNMAVLLGLALKTGKFLEAFSTVTREVAWLRERTDLHSTLIAGAVQQLDGLETRVGLLERG